MGGDNFEQVGEIFGKPIYRHWYNGVFSIFIVEYKDGEHIGLPALCSIFDVVGSNKDCDLKEIVKATLEGYEG